MPDFRPNPDELLRQITKSDQASARGRLKIFFGMCPGVGKTFAMLKAAQERSANGTRVLVGLVETHQRQETQALLQGLELLPRKRTDYKGTEIEEFDLDSALERRPELILVDELAHTNSPGSRHPKRYQDIEELLHAGIDVYSTVNVQHIESRVDLVYQITGVPVRESVPDGFLERANEIEIVDISPEQLLKRLREGKVYLGDRAERAAQNFFKEEALIALRELALRFTAEVVDDKLRDQMTLKGIAGPWNTNERLMVAISQSPFSARLIRATRRMAYNLEAPWVALHVDSGQVLGADDEATLKKNLNTARELGAEVITRRDTSITNALMTVAREKNVTQIVMGRPDRRLLKDLLAGGNLLDQLVNETSEIDIHLIRQRRRPKIVGFRFRKPKFTSSVNTYLKTAIYSAVVGLINYLLLPYAGYRALGFVFLLSVLPVAVLAGLGPTLLVAALSALIWDFCFIPPQFTLEIHEFQDVMMILVYFCVASVAGFLAQRIRKQEQDLIQREYRASVLYEFEKKLAAVSGTESIAGHATQTIQRIFGFPSLVYGCTGESSLPLQVLNALNAPGDEKSLAVARWTLEHQKKAGKGTDTLFSSPCLCYPLTGHTRKVGVLVVYPTKLLPLDQENLLETVAGNLATALQRESLEISSRRAQLLEQSEKMHQTLLNSVSHELRTPLTSILGIASAFQDPALITDEASRTDLVRNLAESAERLNRTVENLLDMSRLSSGIFQIEKNYFEINDFLRGWSGRSGMHPETHPIELDFSEEMFVQGDEKLLDHVLTNLVGNAENYSPDGSKIVLKSLRNQEYAEVQVIDEGPGIPEDLIPRLFERFFRGNQQKKGLGLGLSIAKAILEAHGGHLFVTNRRERSGAIFSMLIPARTLPPEAKTSNV